MQKLKDWLTLTSMPSLFLLAAIYAVSVWVVFTSIYYLSLSSHLFEFDGDANPSLVDCTLFSLLVQFGFDPDFELLGDSDARKSLGFLTPVIVCQSFMFSFGSQIFWAFIIAKLLLPANQLRFMRKLCFKIDEPSKAAVIETRFHNKDSGPLVNVKTSLTWINYTPNTNADSSLAVDPTDLPHAFQYHKYVSGDDVPYFEIEFGSARLLMLSHQLVQLHSGDGVNKQPLFRFMVEASTLSSNATKLWVKEYYLDDLYRGKLRNIDENKHRDVKRFEEFEDGSELLVQWALRHTRENDSATQSQRPESCQ